jgi:hypothetical protein
MATPFSSKFWFSALLAVATGIATVRAAEPVVTGTGSGSDTANGDSISGKLAPDASADIPDPLNLMSGLDKIGIGKPLENWGIDVSGHVEGGFTYQFFQHPDNGINGLTLDYSQNRPILNQATLNIERFIAPETTHWDIGFHVQFLEGTDAQDTASYRSYRVADIKGRLAPTATDQLFDVGGNDSAYQFDIPDAYVDFGIPVGTGLRVRAGRFEFFKPIDPNERIFYSTTFVYDNALPFTNTGVTLAYNVSADFGIEAGFSRGYNVTVDDDNGSIDFIGKAHAFLTKTTELIATGSVGPELPQKFPQSPRFGPPVPAPNTDAYTTLIDIAVDQKLSRQATLIVDGVYSRQFGSGYTNGYIAFSSSDGVPGTIRLNAQYYGVNGTLVYKINSFISLAGRAEWLRDDGGLLSGARRSLYEGTFGATITPFPNSALGQNFRFRPEVRYDYSNVPFFGNTALPVLRKDQLTFGVDAIYNF